MQLNINSFFGLLWSGLFYFQPHPRLLPCLTILRWPISQGTHHLVWQVAQFRRCLILHGTTRTPTDPYDMVAGLSMVYSFSLEETNLPSIYRKRDKLYLSCMEQMGKKPNLENQIREKMRVVEMIRKKNTLCILSRPADQPSKHPLSCQRWKPHGFPSHSKVSKLSGFRGEIPSFKRIAFHHPYNRELAFETHHVRSACCICYSSRTLWRSLTSNGPGSPKIIQKNSMVPPTNRAVSVACPPKSHDLNQSAALSFLRPWGLLVGRIP